MRKLLATASALLALACWTDAFAGSLTLLGAGKASSGGGGGGIPSLSVPTRIGVSEPASATQFAFTPSVSVPSGQSIAVFVFSGAAQANATGCTSPVCTSGGDNLTCDAGVSGTGQAFLCKGVLAHDLSGSDRGGSDTIKVGLNASSGPIIYAVGVPSSGPTAASSATTTQSGNIFDTGSVTLTPTKWVIGFEEDNGNGPTTTPSGGFTGLAASPVVGGLYQVTGFYKQATTSPFDLGVTFGSGATPVGFISYQVFN